MVRFVTLQPTNFGATDTFYSRIITAQMDSCRGEEPLSFCQTDNSIPQRDPEIREATEAQFVSLRVAQGLARKGKGTDQEGTGVVNLFCWIYTFRKECRYLSVPKVCSALCVIIILFLVLADRLRKQSAKPWSVAEG